MWECLLEYKDLTGFWSEELYRTAEKSRTRIFSKSRSDFNFVFIVILFKNVIRLIITEQSLLLVTSREQKKMIFNFDF